MKINVYTFLLSLYQNIDKTDHVFGQKKGINECQRIHIILLYPWPQRTKGEKSEIYIKRITILSIKMIVPLPKKQTNKQKTFLCLEI